MLQGEGVVASNQVGSRFLAHVNFESVGLNLEGKLQTAATVNGPWQDVDSVSPLTLNTDETVHFVRAVR